MRKARSSFAITSSAPSSAPLRPSFHCSATRSAYCSIGSPPVVRIITTAIWLPFRFSNASSMRSSAAFCSAPSVPVWSTTRAIAGMAVSAFPVNGRKANSANARSLNTLLLRAEIDLGRRGDGLLVLDCEVRLRLVAEHHRGEVGRERAHRDVVCLDRLYIAVARYRDAVLGAFELRLQFAEVGVGLELGVVLRH